MDVVPIINNKVSVIIKGVPKKFGAFAIDVTNQTVSSSSIDVNISSPSSDSKKVSQKKSFQNLLEQYHDFQKERDEEKVSTEEIEKSYEKFMANRNAVHEFEVELADYQIEKLVDEGIYIKMSFGIKQAVSFSFPTTNWILLKKRIRKNIKSTSVRQSHTLSITKNIRIRISISKDKL